MKGNDQFRRQKTAARSLAKDVRGQTGAGQAVQVVVGLTVAAIVASYLLPLAIGELVAVDTTGWSSGASELWSILDLVIVLGLFLVFIGMALARGERL